MHADTWSTATERDYGVLPPSQFQLKANRFEDLVTQVPFK